MQNLKDLHLFLTDTQNRVEALKSELDRLEIKFDFGYFFNHYIKIDGKWTLQNYPLPVFTIEGIGDIGVNLDGIFFEKIIEKEQMTEKVFKILKTAHSNLEVYGFENCLSDFKMYEDIQKSPENKIQIGLLFDFETKAATILQTCLKVSALI